MNSAPKYKYLCLSVSILCLILSCTMTRDTPNLSWQSSQTNLIEKQEDLAPNISRYTAYRQSKDAPNVFMLLSDNCNLSNIYPYFLKVYFKSDLGNHTLDLANTQTDQIIVKIDNVHKFDISWDENNLAKMCAKAEDDKVVYRDQESMESIVAAIFEKVAPACHIKFSMTNGWQCSLSPSKTSITKDQISSIRKEVIRGSRQPYSLSRKIALTEQLWSALQSGSKVDLSLNRYCKVLKFSDINEKPLSLGSRYTVDSICDSNNINRVDAANVVLRYAIEEINILKELYRNFSKIGLFQIKVPSQEAPSKDLWVSVVPSDPIDTRIEALKEATAGIKKVSHSKTTCWNPVFSDSNDSIIEIAALLGFMSESNSEFCRSLSTISTSELNETADYLFQALSSETEFVVSNGNAKLIRIPKGSYRYVIQRHSKLPESIKIAQTKNTQGDFLWSRKRPNVIIRKW